MQKSTRPSFVPTFGPSRVASVPNFCSVKRAFGHNLLITSIRNYKIVGVLNELSWRLSNRFHCTYHWWSGEAKEYPNSSGRPMLLSLSVWSQPCWKHFRSASFSLSAARSRHLLQYLWEGRWKEHERWKYLANPNFVEAPSQNWVRTFRAS